METVQYTAAEEELDFVEECDLCGSRQAQPYLTAPDRNWPVHNNTLDCPAPRTPWTLVRCEECSLVYLNPRPALKALHRHYPQTYYAYSTSASSAAGWKSLILRSVRRHRLLWQSVRRTRFGDRFQDPITEMIGWVKPGRILDVGCGAGDALDHFARLGWQTFGVDISEAGVQEARRRGHQAWQGDLTGIDLAAQNMDVVNMAHVLEHTPSPRRVLAAVKRLLRPGGILRIEVPNLGSMWAPVFKGYSVNLDLPRHFYHFTQKTLARLVTEAGFRVRLHRPYSSARFLLQSVLLVLREEGQGVEDLQNFDPAVLLTAPMQKALAPFCRVLEERGQGNHQVLLAEVPR